MTEDLPLLPFQRRHAGKRGEFVVRRHDWLADAAAKAIQRRSHPAWSQLRDEVRVA